MKDIKGIKGNYYIASLIEQGEHEQQDFKFAISDARKIARSLSAFANHSGGRLLIGVKDNGIVAGVRNEEDIYVVEQAAEMHCVPPQQIRVTAFKVDGGLTVMRVEIDRSEVRPVMVKEADGSLRAYYRVKDENIHAPDLMIRAWREAASPGGHLLSLSDEQKILLGAASEAGGTTPERFMVDAHLSKARAEDMIVSLHAMGLIDFVWDGTTFTLTATQP